MPGGKKLGRSSFRFYGPPQKRQENANALLRGQQICNECLNTLKRAFRDTDRFSDLEVGRHRHDFVFSRVIFERCNRGDIQRGQMIAKMNNPLNSGRMLYSTVGFGVNKLREQVTWKHRFHEPDGAPSGELAETEARCEARYLQLLAQASGAQVLALGLRLQAKPKRLACLCEEGT